MSSGSNPHRVMVYIDGFNLYFGLKSRGWKRYYWLDIQRLALNLLKPFQTLVEVKYFTARISANPRDPSKQRRQALFLEALQTLPKARIFYGHYLPKPQSCFKCGSTWNTHEEKMTDVNIAVELVRDAYENLFDTGLLISADSDLAPPVEAVLNRFSEKKVIIICPPDRHSARLEGAGTTTFRLGRKVLQDSQFPDEYPKPDGFILRRPGKWT